MPDSRPERIDARTVLREHAVFICIVAAYFGVTAFLSIIGIVPFSLRVTAYMRASAVMLPVFLLGSLVAMTVRILVVERPKDPAAAILVALHGARIRDRFVLGVPVLLLMPAFAAAFTLLKTSILVVSPETRST